jgi:hypothetical protein
MDKQNNMKAKICSLLISYVMSSTSHGHENHDSLLFDPKTIVSAKKMRKGDERMHKRETKIIT